MEKKRCVVGVIFIWLLLVIVFSSFFISACRDVAKKKSPRPQKNTHNGSPTNNSMIDYPPPKSACNTSINCGRRCISSSYACIIN
ncbi:hypothetical protein HanXRQr2_Chr12g0535511 [Helianthus annuus]|nr:hypothetical protein HanXRQr2_Chr12g0535491 [Helianthus annuus]KAF5777431.1 hypothetical protein HanXRQr2_Chr12g0535511 [Helianthus annuus]KAJ0862239.1 hypothetical protein HanPSC8_Chr12g0515791 [Helianthus annuus]KAJ0862241.1 hypothetical protein HanPSC8_Chr12g0515811 [Helianthus annuus]